MLEEATAKKRAKKYSVGSRMIAIGREKSDGSQECQQANVLQCSSTSFNIYGNCCYSMKCNILKQNKTKRKIDDNR